MGLAARFALWVSLALALVMAGASFFLFNRSQHLVDRSVDRALTLAAEEQLVHSQLEAAEKPHYHAVSQMGTLRGKGVMRTEVVIEGGPRKGSRARSYATEDGPAILLPLEADPEQKDLSSLFLFVTGLVILAGAGVASMIANQVAKPLESLVQDVRTIARGKLRHRTHVTGATEVRDLARAIDKMGDSLAEAQGSEVELGIRRRERGLALQLAQAFLPSEEPWIEGYRVAGRFVASDEPGGGFFDYCQVGERTILFVCDVSGKGVPGSLIGATARAYLRTALQTKEGLAAALQWVNRELYRDVERGLFATAMVVVLDPAENVAQVACAGHKLPLLRWDAQDGQLKALQPNGFALGFDAGPVFDKRLEVIRVPVQAGDRLVLAGKGIASLTKENGEEWGETGLYRSLHRNAQLDPAQLLERVLQEAQDFSGNQPYPSDFSLVILARDPA
ncbi:MAG: SpoIIE family protein phosphatase [Planctomycetes bacterium]|nr:SpoIIE family protein phosphatase [Planctomycetota bacterium]MCB9909635.1 SpoIIE family protein phosphatase [Planctomycetota bacterium]MCB9911876.1 SpoIIE family protein phosphatase [Planctomycetota bacterium]HPF12695.1 SpoIIE family protein phosphatase [Planctomycetota bacterium]HRV80136.1 SpoIIE family protein phosphatase [Planctomycetota bacterium]